MDLLKELIYNIKPITTKDYLLGKHTILMESNNIGLASKLGDINLDISNMNIQEISSLILSNDLGETSLAMAAINSFYLPDSNKIEYLNGYNLILNEAKYKKVGFIGHFSFIKKIRKEIENVTVFELNPVDELDLDIKFMPQIIPQLDYLVITATTLINKTFEDIIKLKSKKTKVMILGPSTPSSEILFDYGIDIIAGTLVSNKKLIIEDIRNNKGIKKQRGRKSYILRKS